MSTIDITKTYRTREGGEVSILSTKSRQTASNYPVIAEIWDKKMEKWNLHFFTSEGTFQLNMENHVYDLLEVKPRVKREYWVNIYPSYESALFVTQKGANSIANSNRLACVKVVIDCEKGEGLD